MTDLLLACIAIGIFWIAVIQTLEYVFKRTLIKNHEQEELMRKLKSTSTTAKQSIRQRRENVLNQKYGL